MLCSFFVLVFFFKQNTAYEMRISDWSSDVCSSDLRERPLPRSFPALPRIFRHAEFALSRGVRRRVPCLASVIGSSRVTVALGRWGHPADRKSTRLNSSH